ncbi:hypothetical protein ACOME3_004874 [Neoechinorhynchus agilis]
MLSNPSNVAEFGYEYFKALRVQRDDQRRDNRSRLTIIGESFDPTTDRFVFNEKFAKSAKDRQLVLQIIPQIFMFSQCSTDELNMILKLMKSTKFNRNSDIISKDEFVSNFYIVYESAGEVVSPETKERFERGAYFEEMALIHTYKSDKKIKSHSKFVRLLHLDGFLFRRLIRTNAYEKYRQKAETIRRVPLLKELTGLEVTRIIDLFDEWKFGKNERICRKGDRSDCVFFVLEGSVDLLTQQGSVSTKYKTCLPNDYFGELSLIFYIEWQYTAVTGDEGATLIVLGVDSFERSLGTKCIEIMKRNRAEFGEIMLKIKSGLLIDPLHFR